MTREIEPNKCAECGKELGMGAILIIPGRGLFHMMCGWKLGMFAHPLTHLPDGSRDDGCL
mgnify:CR=1 FL=1